MKQSATHHRKSAPADKATNGNTGALRFASRTLRLISTETAQPPRLLILLILLSLQLVECFFQLVEHLIDFFQPLLQLFRFPLHLNAS